MFGTNSHSLVPDLPKLFEFPENVVYQIVANVSSSEFTFTFRVTIIVSVRPGTKTETIIVTLNVKVNPEEDTLAAICCTQQGEITERPLASPPNGQRWGGASDRAR